MNKLFLTLALFLFIFGLSTQRALASNVTGSSVSPNPAYTNSQIAITFYIYISPYADSTRARLSFSPSSGAPTYVDGASVNCSGSASTGRNCSYLWHYQTTGTTGSFTVNFTNDQGVNGSAGFSVTTPPPSCTGPSTPSNPTYNGSSTSTNVSLTPTFGWTQSSWGSPAGSYSSIVYIYTWTGSACAPSASYSCSQTGQSNSMPFSKCNLSALSPNTKYCWNAGAYNQNGSSCAQYAFGPQWQFTTQVSPPPTCSISASPNPVGYNTAATVTWSSTNATSCTVTPGSWTGTSGSQSTGNLTANTTYTENCTGAGGSCTANTTVTVDTPPTVTNIALSSPTVVPDNSTQYSFTLTASDPDGGTDISFLQALINLTGLNAGQYRGYLVWSPGNYWANSSYKDQVTCSDGTFGAIYVGTGSPNYGPNYIHLKSCSSSISGLTRTAVFTLTFDPTFTSPTSNNDVAALAIDARGGYYGWFDLNKVFGLSFPVPVISYLSPSSANGQGPAFTLTVNGSKFMANSVVNWNGSSRTTTFVGPNQLTAAVSAADIATPGTYSVTVVTSTPGGGTSNSVSFPVTCATPTVNITGTLSGSVPAGVQICADGSNCVSPSTNAYSLPVSSATSHTVSSIVPIGYAVSPGPSTVTVVCTNVTGPTYSYTSSTTCP